MIHCEKAGLICQVFASDVTNSATLHCFFIIYQPSTMISLIVFSFIVTKVLILSRSRAADKNLSGDFKIMDLNNQNFLIWIYNVNAPQNAIC